MKPGIIKITIYVAVLLFIFLTLQQLTYLKTDYITPENGSVDLTSEELSTQLYEISDQGWEFYPGQLYTPEDFEEGTTAAPHTEKKSSEKYGTYRLLLNLPEDKIYAITGKSFSFSQRVFINGELAGEIGNPAETAEETIPAARTYVYHFTAKSEPTEVIFQVANFHHKQSLRCRSFMISVPDVISQYRILTSIRTSLIIGCLITAALYFVGMYIFFYRRPHYLFLPLVCLTLAVRIALVEDDKMFLLFFPDFNWFSAIRLEYLCHIGFIVFLLYYFAYLYPGMIHKAFLGVITGASAIFGLIILFGDSLLYTQLLGYYAAVWVTASIWTLWKLIQRLKYKEFHTILIFAGLLVFVATALYDEVSYLFVTDSRGQNTLIIGLLVCVFMNVIALTVQFSDMEKSIVQLETQKLELDETNRLLDRLNIMKTQFMNNLSHEMRTPLTVMSANAQLSKELLNSDDLKDEIQQNLELITGEAERMARMVSTLLNLGSSQEAQNGMEKLDLGALLKQGTEVYRSMIEKKGNHLAIDIPEKAFHIYGNADMLTQVLFNLLSNANRYTHNGEIFVCAAGTEDGESVCVTVRDNGAGISAEILPDVLDRQVKDGETGNTGFGLAISNTIIKRHGGTIEIESEEGKGTAVHFNLKIET